MATTIASNNRVMRDFLAGMTPPQQRAYRRLVSLHDEPRADLLWHHDVGRCVAALYPAKPDGKHVAHGESRFTDLAKRLQGSPWHLYKARQFSDLFTLEEAEKLAALGLRWSRVSLTFPIQNSRKCGRLLRQAAKERWSIQDLRWALQGQYKPQPLRTGRRTVAPKTCKAGLGQVIAVTGRWLRFHREVWSRVKNLRVQNKDPLVQKLELLSGSERTEDLKKLAEAASELLEKIARTAREFRKELADALG